MNLQQLYTRSLIAGLCFHAYQQVKTVELFSFDSKSFFRGSLFVLHCNLSKLSRL